MLSRLSRQTSGLSHGYKWLQRPWASQLKPLTRQDHQWQCPQEDCFTWRPYSTIFRCTAMDVREELLKFIQSHLCEITMAF